MAKKDPGKPETPDKPETPGKPETPDKPETPGKLETPDKPEKKEEKKNQEMAGHLYNLDPFMVNLVDTGKLRYLKIRMSLESSESKPNEEYDKRLPQLRDVILSVLAAKTQSDINDSQGKKKLKEELTNKLNTVLIQFKLKTVFFTEFVIQ
jgi:flagellar protein FliL